MQVNRAYKNMNARVQPKYLDERGQRQLNNKKANGPMVMAQQTLEHQILSTYA